MQTLLVQSLLEVQEHYDSLQGLADAESMESKISSCASIIEYMKAGFVELAHRAADRDMSCQVMVPRAKPPIDVEKIRAAVLRWICTVEEDLSDFSPEALARLEYVRKEWRQRFGNSVIADSV